MAYLGLSQDNQQKGENQHAGIGVYMSCGDLQQSQKNHACEGMI